MAVPGNRHCFYATHSSMRLEDMKLITLVLAAIGGIRNAIDDMLTGLVTKGGAVGDIYFNVPRHEAHGILEVRHNATSGGHSLISFRVARPYRLHRKRITGREVNAILTQAMCEGFDPVRLTIMGRDVNLYGRAVKLAQQDLRERSFGESFFAQRIATPEEAGLCLTQLPKAS